MPYLGGIRAMDALNDDDYMERIWTDGYRFLGYAREMCVNPSRTSTKKGRKEVKEKSKDETTMRGTQRLKRTHMHVIRRI